MAKRKRDFGAYVWRLEAAAHAGDREASERLGDLSERQAAERRVVPLRRPTETLRLLMAAAEDGRRPGGVICPTPIVGRGRVRGRTRNL